jgi:hypothetical protein
MPERDRDSSAVASWVLALMLLLKSAQVSSELDFAGISFGHLPYGRGVGLKLFTGGLRF